MAPDFVKTPSSENFEFPASEPLISTTVRARVILKKNALDSSFIFLSNAVFESVLGPLVRELLPKSPNHFLA